MELRTRRTLAARIGYALRDLFPKTGSAPPPVTLPADPHMPVDRLVEMIDSDTTGLFDTWRRRHPWKNVEQHVETFAEALFRALDIGYEETLDVLCSEDDPVTASEIAVAQEAYGQLCGRYESFIGELSRYAAA